MKMRVDRLGLVLEDRRAGVEVLQIEHPDHDRGDRIARNAEHQGRNPGAADRGIVGGAAFDDALDWPVPNFSGSFENRLVMA